jgi:hypothetical protein
LHHHITSQGSRSIIFIPSDHRIASASRISHQQPVLQAKEKASRGSSSIMMNSNEIEEYDDEYNDEGLSNPRREGQHQLGPLTASALASLSPNDKTYAIDVEDEEDGLLVGPPPSNSTKRDYNRVAGAEDNDENDEDRANTVIQQRVPLWQTVLHANLLPDDRFTVFGIRIFDGVGAVKLLKFLIFTLLGIVSMYHIVRWMDWENDAKYTLSDMITYELSLIVQDAVLFFIVGRLYLLPSVDHLAWIGVAFLANIYSSYITSFSFLQYSATLYEMHCTWPLELWAFTCVAVPIVVAVVVLHVLHAVRTGVMLMKLIEITATFFLLMGPLLTSPYFHLHHWFAGFFFGMHFNFDVWWSRAVMAWCWGCYINGIAVYGRDPVLTCGYAYFLTISQHCPYVTCYLQALAHPTYHNDTHNHTVVDVAPMGTPDWRNCSADAYHP